MSSILVMNGDGARKEPPGGRHLCAVVKNLTTDETCGERLITIFPLLRLQGRLPRGDPGCKRTRHERTRRRHAGNDGNRLAHFPGTHRAGGLSSWRFLAQKPEVAVSPKRVLLNVMAKKMALAGDLIAPSDTDSPCTPSQKVAAEFANGAFINI